MADENTDAGSGFPGDAGLVPVVPVVTGGNQRGLATPEDVAAFQERFLRLLERRTALYTMGDSSSVPDHVALDVLLSVCFVLGIDPDGLEIPGRLLAVDLEDEFRRRLAAVERKVERAGDLWREAAAGMPPIPSASLQDTIASLGDFPRIYDFRSMAHEVPVVFDYPLCHPVPDTLLGVDYINEYLRRLILEFDFLRRFELDDCVRVLERSAPGYTEAPLSLYEPVATNAIGRAAAGMRPKPLLLSEAERAAIVDQLRPMDEAGRLRTLSEAARAVCDAVGLDDEAGRRYLLALVPELLPRIASGLASGDLRGVFA